MEVAKCLLYNINPLSSETHVRCSHLGDCPLDFGTAVLWQDHVLKLIAGDDKRGALLARLLAYHALWPLQH